MKIKFIMTSLFIIYFLMGCMGNSYLKNPNDQALNLAPVCKVKENVISNGLQHEDGL